MAGKSIQPPPPQPKKRPRDEQDDIVEVESSEEASGYVTPEVRRGNILYRSNATAPP